MRKFIKDVFFKKKLLFSIDLLYLSVSDSLQIDCLDWFSILLMELLRVVPLVFKHRNVRVFVSACQINLVRISTDLFVGPHLD